MKRGLIPQQMGLAERVRPEGEIKVAWEAWLKEQVNREDMLRWARSRDERPLLPIQESKRRFDWSVLSALIP